MIAFSNTNEANQARTILAERFPGHPLKPYTVRMRHAETVEELTSYKQEDHLIVIAYADRLFCLGNAPRERERLAGGVQPHQ